MTPADLSARLRTVSGSRRVLAAVIAVLVAVATVSLIVIGSSSPSVRTSAQFLPGTPEGNAPVGLDTTLYLPAHTPAPAVVLAHGYGGTKDSVAAEARTLAQHGYVVLAYSARGFGRSGGLIHFDSPRYEVNDASNLVSYLTQLPQVVRSGGRPEIAVAGASYGGGLALLLAERDSRVQAVAADITWNNLTSALYPNAAGTQPGVFKKLWAGLLFSAGLPATSTTPCGRYAPDVCAAYQASVRLGYPTPGLLAIMKAASPATAIDKITAPTLLTQGEQDSLFPLSEANANARGIAASGTPVKVVWRSGGHDTDTGAGDATGAALSWFGAVFAHQVHGRQSFELAEQGSVVSAATGRVTAETLRASGYPGVLGQAATPIVTPVAGRPQSITAPVGGLPAAVTAIPGLGELANFATNVGVAPVPGQTAAFLSPVLSSAVLIAGAPSVNITVSSPTAGDGTLFAALRDVSPDGTESLPAQLVAPFIVPGLRPNTPTTITVQLPSIVHTVPSGHRLVLTVSTTDFAYQLPAVARQYLISVTNPAPVRLPTVSGTVLRAGHPIAWLLAGVAACLVAAGAVGFVLRRRRRELRFDPALAEVPVRIDALVKEYAGGYRAVDGVSLTVERGQVLGLLGPNGAGKTTALRVLVGLILPTSGSVHIFGEPIVPGAAVLSRLGAFIEGPGFLPHLSGRDNLRLFWAATARPESEAYFDTALDIAGLGSSIDRRVRTYSHGMKQRLGIAQAMLGLPELLVLDEPTNGLDPPQIAEMREVLQRYAATGRTVVVSSHLLAEVEQTCTHVAVMHKGKLVAAGSVVDIAGAGGMQLAVRDPERAAAVLAAAGIDAELVPARRALEDVFLDLVGSER